MMRNKKLILMMTILLLFVGCGKDSAQKPVFQLDKQGEYTGFQSLPDGYTAEQAQTDGCYVFSEGKAIGGESAWNSFLSHAKSKKDTSIRIVSFYNDVVYYKDLFYQNDSYHVFDSSSDEQKDKEFRYLLDLRGRMNGTAKESRFVVVTDDKDLKFQDVVISMISSSSDVINSISPYTFVLME